MKIIFTGSGEFGLPTLQWLLKSSHELVAVYTQPDRPAGRGRKITPTPIGAYALERGLKMTPTESLNAEQLPPADLMVVIAFGQKIAPAAVGHPRFGSINLHASRLPKYRGAAPINWAILRGEEFTGNSIIRVAPKMDAGAILNQSSLKIGETETAGELHDRLAIDGVALVEKTLGEIEAGSLREVQQDDSQSTQAPKLDRSITNIDWKATGTEIARKIRGLYPWPGCRVRLLDAAGLEKARLTLARAGAVHSEGVRWHPGEIQTTGFVTAAGEAAVEILDVHPEGGRGMSLADYRRGHAWVPGLRLESL